MKKNGVIKKCENCGVGFYIRRSHSEQACCSRECAYAFRVKNHTESRGCLGCGNEFLARVGDKSIYCSRLCANENKSRQKKELLYKNCKRCNKRFQVKPSHFEQRVTCSKECMYKLRFGENVNRRDPHPKLNEILSNKKLHRYIELLVKRRIEEFYSLDIVLTEDIMQEYFLQLLKGNSTYIENITNYCINKEIKKGITRKSECDFSFDTYDVVEYAKTTYDNTSNDEYVKKIGEVAASLTPNEFKFLVLSIKGFCKQDIIRELRNRYDTTSGQLRQISDKIRKAI
jgi:hypothetical protein